MSPTASIPARAEAYLLSLRAERGYSARTIEGYRHELGVLAEVCDGIAPERIDEHRLRAAVASASRAGLGPRSVARRLSAWRGFFDWLAAQGDIERNPARGIRAPRAPRRLPKALAPDLTARLLAAPTCERFENLRDHAIAELFYSAGIRLAELCDLDAAYHEGHGREASSSSWLDLEAGEVTVRGKGSKTRTAPVGRAANQALRAWLAARSDWLAAHPGADPRPLFLSRRGTRLSRRAVEQRIRAMARREGLPVHVHPHVLRHSFASHLLQSSGDLRAVQELLGHANITTTQVYTGLDFQRLAAVYDKAHPRARRREDAD